MKKSFKPASWIYPQPALVMFPGTKQGRLMPWSLPGAASMTRTGGFMLDHNHKTTDNILETGAFTVSMATLKTMAS